MCVYFPHKIGFKENLSTFCFINIEYSVIYLIQYTIGTAKVGKTLCASLRFPQLRSGESFQKHPRSNNCPYPQVE